MKMREAPCVVLSQSLLLFAAEDFRLNGAGTRDPFLCALRHGPNN